MRSHAVLGVCACRLVPAVSILFLSSCWGPQTRLPSDDLFRRPDAASARFDDFVIEPSARKTEVDAKVQRVRNFLATKGLDGLLLTKETTFSWITGGGEDFILHSIDEAQVKVLVSKNTVTLISNNIEVRRLVEEVVGGLGFTVEEFKYYEPQEEAALIAKYCPDPTRVVTDATNPGEMQALDPKDLLDLLFPLTPGEIEKYRWLGRKCVEVLEAVAEVVRPGMSEYDIQYLIAREMWYWDIFPTVNLASVDQRVRMYKHPFPEGAKLERYVNLNVCVRRWGMIISTSRLMHFGPPDEEFHKVFVANGNVMASMLHVTRPGNTFRQVLQANEEGYAAAGHPDEWQRHLQGGPILTAERITLLRDLPDAVIKSGMALAYNPSCKGSKHEDTFIVFADRLEILTPCIDWPTRKYVIDGKEYYVPDLKIVD